MRFVIYLVVLAGAVLAVPAQDFATPLIPPDGRRWVVIDGQDAGRETVRTLVPHPQTATNWTEKVTLQRLPGLQRLAPREYFQRAAQGIEKASGNRAKVEVVTEGPYGLLYAWRLRDKDSFQEELAVILPGPAALHHIRYTRVDQPWKEGERDEWIRRWQQITLRRPGR